MGWPVEMKYSPFTGFLTICSYRNFRNVYWSFGHVLAKLHENLLWLNKTTISIVLDFSKMWRLTAAIGGNLAVIPENPYKGGYGL